MNSYRTSNVYYRSLELVERFVNQLLKDKSDVETLKKLSPYINDFSTALEYDDARNKIYNRYVSKVDSTLTELNSDEIMHKFVSEVEQIDAKELGKNCEKRKHILDLIQKYTEENNDEEIETVSENLNHVDPITKLPISDPVKNIKCGHIYEKNSIAELIKMNKFTKCPIPGCVASDYVRTVDLVSDYTLKRMLSDKSNEGSQKRMKIVDFPI